MFVTQVVIIQVDDPLRSQSHKWVDLLEHKSTIDDQLGILDRVWG